MDGDSDHLAKSPQRRSETQAEGDGQPLSCLSVFTCGWRNISAAAITGVKKRQAATRFNRERPAGKAILIQNHVHVWGIDRNRQLTHSLMALWLPAIVLFSQRSRSSLDRQKGGLRNFGTFHKQRPTRAPQPLWASAGAL